MSPHAPDPTPEPSAPASGSTKDHAQKYRHPSSDSSEEGEIDEPNQPCLANDEAMAEDEKAGGAVGSRSRAAAEAPAKPRDKPKLSVSAAAAPDAPPLPSEPVPQAEDDGWEPHWNANDSNWWFYNRFTGLWQLENPRVPQTTTGPNTAAIPTPPQPVPDSTEMASSAAVSLSKPDSIAGGYNPAIHGSYDENAWYAKNTNTQQEPGVGLAGGTTTEVGADGDDSDQLEYDYESGSYFNRATGQWQAADQGPERHADEARSRRQMSAFFDVDAAANQHDGRSLKAERSGKKPTRSELKAFKEKRKARKEEKRRAWLRD